MIADSDLLISLYRAARELSSSAFQDHALRLFQPVLRFDSAIWGRGYFESDAVHAALIPIEAVTLNIDPMGFAHWKAINRADTIIPLARKSPGVTLNFHAPHQFSGAADIAMRDYTRKFGRQNNLATLLASSCTPMIEWCSLYRAKSDHFYAEDERRHAEQLVRHLSEALKINRLAVDASSLTVGDKASDEHAALGNVQGELISAEPRFLEACSRQWRQFDGARLPPLVVEHLALKSQGRLELSLVTIRHRRMGEYVWLTLRTVKSLSPLSPRVRQVADMFSHGLQTKQIANKLGISVSTVRNELSAAYKKLDVSSRSGLANMLNALEEKSPP